MKEGMNSERRNEELKEGRKVSGSCAEILLTCTYLYLLKMKEGMNNRREKEWGIQRRKEWLMREGMTEKEWCLFTCTYLYLLKMKEGMNNGREKEWEIKEGRKVSGSCAETLNMSEEGRNDCGRKEWLRKDDNYLPVPTCIRWIWRKEWIIDERRNEELREGRND